MYFKLTQLRLTAAVSFSDTCKWYTYKMAFETQALKIDRTFISQNRSWLHI